MLFLVDFFEYLFVLLVKVVEDCLELVAEEAAVAAAAATGLNGS